jgi:hypothetical protein
MKCCGLNGAADYKISGSLPMSCCDVVEHVCSKTYARGCEAALTEFAAVKLAEITITTFAVALFLVKTGLIYHPHKIYTNIYTAKSAKSKFVVCARYSIHVLLAIFISRIVKLFYDQFLKICEFPKTKDILFSIIN